MGVGDITELVSIIIGVIGVIGTVYFYLLSRKAKEPCWDILSNNLIQGFSSELPELIIFYKDLQIENLTISKVIFWNAGRDTIDQEDIVNNDPIRIVCQPGVRILDIKVIARNKEPNQFSCQLAAVHDAAFINFDYLDEKNGGVIQVIHTGLDSKDLLVVGTIKGAKKLEHRRVYPQSVLRTLPNSFYRKLDPSLQWILDGFITLFTISSSIGWLFIYYKIIIPNHNFDAQDYLFLGVLCFFGLFSIYLYANLITKKVPIGLEEFQVERK